MPRQIDLFPQNLQVNNDPTNRLGVTSAQINKLNGEIPAKIAAAQAQAVTGFLTLLDQETGLDLLGLWNDYQSLVSFIEAGLTTSFNGIEAALQTLVNNASNAWTQIEDFLLTGDWADLATAWTDIFGTAQEAEANWQTLFTELGFSVSTATQLADFLSGVSNTASNALTPSSSLNASNLWGLIPTQVVGSVAATAVVDVSPNPLLNPNFESAISVSPGSGWVWDSTVYFTPPSGDTAPGSAKVTADGVLHALRSNLIPVASGQHLTVSLPVLASGLVSTGTPLALHVITFNGNTQTGITTVTAIAAPSGASTGWVNPPSGSKGGTLSGTYPVASGVTQVQLRLVVDTTATAGSVWFGNATASLSGGLIANLQSDLSTLQSDSAASTAAFSTFMSSIQSAITGYTSWTSFIAAMESAWITYSTTESGLLSSEVATLQQIINSLFGINTSTGLMAASNVSNVLGQGSLGDDVQAILDYIANALGHSGTGHTLTQIETYLGLIPAANLPTGVQSANTYWSTLMTNLFGASTPASTVQSTALPTAVQSANTYWSTLMTNLFGGSTPASTIKVGAVPTGVPATNIANVLGGANLGADVSSVHSTASTNTTNLNNTWSWLFGTTTPSSSNQVVAGAVPAVGGQQNLLQAVQAGWDQLVQAFTGTTTTNHSLGGLANAASGVVSSTSAALSTAQAATMVQAQQATAKPGYMAIDSTMDAVFPLSHMIASPTYITVTSAASTIGFIRTSDNISKLSVAFLGSYTGTLTTLVINVYLMNTATGAMTQVISGSNISSAIGTSLGWVYYTFPSAIAAAPGNVYAVQLTMTGSGSISLMGLSNSTFPQNSSVFPKALGASTVSSSSIAPTHDSTGAGSFTSTSGTSFNWTHIIGATANAIMIGFFAASAVSSVTVGASAASLVGSENFGGGNIVYLYQLQNPPVGAQPVQVTLSSSSHFVGNSDSYIGVASFGTVSTHANSNGGVTSASGQTAVAMIGELASGAPGTLTPTQRWNNGNSTSQFWGAFGDGAGSSSVNFSSTNGSGFLGGGMVGTSLVGVSAYSPTYSTNVPWFGLGTSAITAIPAQAPVTASYSTAGTYTYTLPTWFQVGVDFLDVIALGPGGGGGGGAGAPGSTGGNTTVTVGGTTVTGTAGPGGIAGNCPQSLNYGGSPGNETYNSVTYYGGSTSAYGYGLVTVGSSPGGGGAGGGTGGVYAYGGSAGSWATRTFSPTGTTVSVTVGAGGAANPSFLAESGADGAVWLVARQA